MYQIGNSNNSPNLDFLMGKELLQVCVGLYQVILKFTEELEITIEGTYRLNDEESQASGDHPISSTCLIRFLGQTIQVAKVQPNQEVLISFSNMESLSIEGGAGDAESFSITYGSLFISA